jgi:ABC-2 type transport system ATP-binding protein/lipopolysaccharide transport system ATP-binding protein
MPHIRLSHVDFSYPIFELTGRSLKVTVMRQVTGGGISKGEGVVRVDALRDISLDLRPGDRLGLVGHNGSGKSTLLRLIAGLAYPTAGRADIRGRVLPLIDKGMGINPELSGFANIELPLRLLGASDAEVKAAKEEIPEWTGLGPFMNMPFRTYSEGMKARLSFALCTAIEGDILVLDEWIGAGDAAFIARAEERLAGFLNRTEIVVLATHSIDLMKRVCNVAAWMERGRIIMVGPPDMIADAYLHSTDARMLAAAE